MGFFAPLNALIEAVYEAKLGSFIYDAWNILDFALIALFCLWYRNNPCKPV